MENYLSGRGSSFESPKEKVGFTPYLDSNSDEENIEMKKESIESKEYESEVIYEEKDCPKVEVLSTDGVPAKIVIHLQDGKLLEINCLY